MFRHAERRVLADLGLRQRSALPRRDPLRSARPASGHRLGRNPGADLTGSYVKHLARAAPNPVGRDAGPVRAGSGAVLFRAVAREVHVSASAVRPGTYAETSRAERGD